MNCVLEMQEVYLISSYYKIRETYLRFYSTLEYKNELKHFERVLVSNIYRLNQDKIRSSGYVIDTLEASLWCLLNNQSYHDSVLSAVNLGGDTDTIACLVGGVAGFYYGFKNIPKSWIQKIVRREDIAQLANRFYDSLNLYEA